MSLVQHVLIFICTPDVVVTVGSLAHVIHLNSILVVTLTRKNTLKNVVLQMVSTFFRVKTPKVVVGIIVWLR